MPKLSDDESDEGGNSKRNEGKSSNEKRRQKAGPNTERRSSKDEESRRNLKWISFAKPRMVFGFDHLGSNNVPIMSGKTRGISMCFEKISGWHIPPQICQDLGLRLNNFEFSVQLSLSMFHLSSSSFFGSTWMGRSVPLEGDDDELPDLIDLEYNEIVYLISRLADPSCVGVVEIVVSKISTVKKLVTAQYGCGWTIINLFSLPAPQDLENGHENVPTTSCPFFQGSPRDLALNSNIAILKTRLKEISGCSLLFKLYSQRKLLRAQRLIAENEAVGRFDVIPGIMPKSVTLPGMSKQKSICCIGDEELVKGGRDGGVFVIPTSPSVAIPITLNLLDCQVRIPNRSAYEGKVRTCIAKNMNALLSEDDEVKILSRTLKIGLHNGHTIIGGEWQSVVLKEDRDNKDVLLTKEQTIIVNGYVPHELTALALLIEYQVGVKTAQRTQHNAQTILNSTAVDNKVVTVVTLGVALYVPYNGTKMILRNGSEVHTNGPPGDDEELGIELLLRTDDVCTILTPQPLFSSLDNSVTAGKVKKRTSTVKKSDRNKGERVWGRDDDKEEEEEEEEDFSSAIRIAFDLIVLDTTSGEVIKDNEWIPSEEHSSEQVRRNTNRGREGSGDEKEEEEGNGGKGRGGGASPRRENTRVPSSVSSPKVRRGSTASSRKGISLSTAQRRRPSASEGYDSDGYSVSDSIVGGDSISSNLVLDPLLYSGRHNVNAFRDRDGDREGRRENSRDRNISSGRSGYPYTFEEDRTAQFNVPKDRGSLLAQTMQAKLNPPVGSNPKGYGRDNGDILEDHDVDYRDANTHINAPPSKSIVPYGGVTRSGVTVVTAGGHGINHARELSRGARSRLGRHGFDGAIMDSAVDERDLIMGRRIESAGLQPVDVELEARDALALHDITIQFAGYRSASGLGLASSNSFNNRHSNSSNNDRDREGSSASSSSSSSSSSSYRPHSIYCSYQFYSCQPTRTESMRLLPADAGQLNVLCRDESHARDEAPLALRYLIDCSDSSPTEGLDFAEYMSQQFLSVDVWDSDSLLLLGSCNVPLRKIMRQGQAMAKCALECDVIYSDENTRTIGGISTSVIYQGGVGVGCVIGAMQVILSNRGDYGRNKHSKLTDVPQGIEGLNWRAHNSNQTHSNIKGKSRHRPTVSVRARPLSENAPELSQALLDHRGDEGGRSMRSLTSARGEENGRTLTYDDVAILFKRFQGSVKGTVQYSGMLMNLMDVPSRAAAFRKLSKVYQLCGAEHGFEKELSKYTDSHDMITPHDLSDCLKQCLELHGINQRGEVELIVRHFSGENNRGIEIQNVLSLCKEEADRQGWLQISKRIRAAVQKAYVTGTDIEQLLVGRDKDGDHFINSNDFTLFLRDLSGFKKLSPLDIKATVVHFSRNHGAGSGSNLVGDSVSLKEVMAFVGKEYVGNVLARMKRCITNSHSNSEVKHQMKGGVGGGGGGAMRTSSEILRVLQSHSTNNNNNNNNSNNSEIASNMLTLSQLETALGVLGVYADLSHEQVKSCLKDVTLNQQNCVTFVQFFTFFELPLPEGLSVSAAATTSASTSSKKELVGLDAEELLRLLLAQVQKKGLSVDEAFRHFDTDGNGYITKAELEEGLSELGIFDNQNVRNWRSQIPDMILKFDKSGDGNVSLKEFFAFLGAEDYVPNIIQRMTKIFAIATEKGLSFKDIFSELDGNKDGQLDSAELKKGLQSLGTFGDITVEDAVLVVKQFDHSGNGSISLEEFISFFSSRVKQAAEERMEKKNAQIIAKFIEIVNNTERKNAIISTLFEDNNGRMNQEREKNISAGELSSALKTLPHLKSLSNEEVRVIVSSIDANLTGEISLKKFKGYIEMQIEKHTPHKKDGISRSTVQSDGDFATRLRAVFAKAVEKGLSVKSAFEHLDRDNNGQLSATEMHNALLKLPHFRDVSEEEVERLVQILDSDSNGFISLEEFIFFVHGNVDFITFKESAKAISSRPATPRETFRTQLKRIAIPDGGIEGLLAYLDEDEDGVIATSSFLRLLTREGMFQHMSEEEVDDILRHMEWGGGDGRVKGVSVVALLKMMDNKNGDYAEETKSNNNRKNKNKSDYNEDDEDEDENESKMDNENVRFTAVEYDFSPDPETRSLEKKLRSLGHALSKKGVDVEGMFRDADARLTGMVKRTEFVEVMSKIGLSVLEKGDALDEARLLMNGSESEGPNSGVTNTDARKMQLMQMKRLKGREGGYANNAARAARNLIMNAGANSNDGRVRGNFQEHLESMALIDWYRNSQKRTLLQKVLSHSLASSVYVYPRFGKTLFFEQPLTNPYGHEERFLLSVEDAELRIVTKYEEWSYLRTHTRTCVGVLGSSPAEAEMFDRDGYGNIQVALLPHETLYVPFTVLTLVPNCPKGVKIVKKSRGERKGGSYEGKNNERERGGRDGRDGRGGDAGEESKYREGERYENKNGNEEDENEGPSRVAEVRVVSCTHGHVVAVIRVNICYRPPIINRTIRFYEPESGLMRRRILLKGMQGNAYPNEPTAMSKFVHCVEMEEENSSNSAGVGASSISDKKNDRAHSKVVVEWGSSGTGSGIGSGSGSSSGMGPGSLDILIRYRCGLFPSMGSFYLLIYDDPYQCTLHQVWHVIVQSRQRVDVHSSLGSVSTVDLMVRGDRYARRSRLFSTESHRMTFEPKGTFQLIPGALNRVAVQFRPNVAGTRRIQLNLIDTDSKELISAWLLHTTAVAPITTRNYDVDILRDRPMHKKIVFKNPWDSSRRFTLTSSDDSVMRPRVPIMEVAPYGNSYLRLWFNSSSSSVGEACEVFLFLNDETGQSEESFQFTVRCKV